MIATGLCRVLSDGAEPDRCARATGATTDAITNPRATTLPVRWRAEVSALHRWASSLPGPLLDRVLACRICLDFGDPSRGDIIVFSTPPEAKIKCGEGGTFVKRLIGLPGDTVSERSGFVCIDGSPLKEPYIAPGHRHTQTGSWYVPKGEYFFMGDNRIESCDSRLWGPVPRHDLIGTVFFVYWPPNRIGFP